MDSKAAKPYEDYYEALQIRSFSPGDDIDVPAVVQGSVWFWWHIEKRGNEGFSLLQSQISSGII